MAAITTNQQQPTKAQFYVYEICAEDGVVLYVGKGSGNRKTASKRHHNGHSAIEVARFWNEEDAYKFEISHIAKLSPPHNKHKGGNGSRVGFSNPDSPILRRKKSAKLLCGYYFAYKYLTSKVEFTIKDEVLMRAYIPEVRKTLDALNISKLVSLAYGR